MPGNPERYGKLPGRPWSRAPVPLPLNQREAYGSVRGKHVPAFCRRFNDPFSRFLGRGAWGQFRYTVSRVPQSPQDRAVSAIDWLNELAGPVGRHFKSA